MVLSYHQHLPVQITSGLPCSSVVQVRIYDCLLHGHMCVSFQPVLAAAIAVCVVFGWVPVQSPQFDLLGAVVALAGLAMVSTCYPVVPI